MSVNPNVPFNRGSFSKLKRLSTLVFYACLNYKLKQKTNKITIYYDYSYCSNNVRLINIVPRIEYSEKMQYLLNVAVELNTPTKLVGVCIKNVISGHEIVECMITLEEDEEIGNYVQMYERNTKV